MVINLKFGLLWNYNSVCSTTRWIFSSRNGDSGCSCSGDEINFVSVNQYPLQAYWNLHIIAPCVDVQWWGMYSENNFKTRGPWATPLIWAIAKSQILRPIFVTHHEHGFSVWISFNLHYIRMHSYSKINWTSFVHENIFLEIFKIFLCKYISCWFSCKGKKILLFFIEPLCDIIVASHYNISKCIFKFLRTFIF